VAYSGSHWLAVWWSITYSPVNLAAIYEFDPYQPVARSNTSGSWRCAHSSLGPTAWLDSNVPARSRMFCSPNSAVSDWISAVARVSTPYRMAGRSGRRSSSHNTRHGPTPLTHMPAMMAPPGICAIRAVLISHTSRHHNASASTSAQPCRGRFIEWAMVSDARTDPDASTSTPFVLPVPMSMPSSKSTR
jgi:hypothetical protein